MRILYITARADIGGGQQGLYRLAQQTLASSEVFIACPREEPYWTRFLQLVGAERLFEIPHRRLSLARVWALRDFIKRNRIDLVHSHGLGAGLYSRPVGFLANIPSVHTFHGVVFKTHKPLWTAPRLMAEWLLSSISKRLIVVSDSEKNHLSQWLFPHGRKMQKVRYGIPENPAFQPHALSQTTPTRILWVGRLHEQKNPLQVVEIAKHLKRINQSNSFVFEMVGGGSLMTELKEKIESEKLGDVILLQGPISDVSPFYKQSHIFLLTSRWEGLPNVILEAMNEGLPVIASRVHGNVDIVDHGKTGLLFDPNSPQQAAELINSVLTGEIDTRALCETAKAHLVLEYGLERYGDEHLTVYRELIKT